MTVLQTDSPKFPELRFSEFSGEWDTTKLGDLGRIKSGVGFPSSEQGGKVGTPFLKVSDMNLVGNETEIRSANNYVSDIQISELKLKPITKPSLIFAKVGAAIFLERKRLAKNFLIDNNMMAFSPNNKIDLKFAQILLENTRLSKFAQVGALPSYNGSDIASIKVTVPCRAEQEKIAAFLGVVDDKIAQLSRKKDLLEQYKNGCMQKLFSQEIRFKNDNGSDFPDWEEKRLGDVLQIGSGKDYKHLSAGNIPVFGTGGLMTFVNDYLYDGDSVGIGRKGTIDKPVWLSGKFWTVDTLFYTHSFRGVEPKYIYAVFQTINWLQYNEASGVPSLSKSTLEKIKLNLPKPEEQKKIADFLSAIDGKIELVDSELELARTFKKGLLQQMFV